MYAIRSYYAGEMQPALPGLAQGGQTVVMEVAVVGAGAGGQVEQGADQRQPEQEEQGNGPVSGQAVSYNFV